MKYGKEIVVSRGQYVELSVLSNVGVAVVKFDATGSRVNLLSSAVMAELDAVLDLLSARSAPQLKRVYGAVFSSGKPDSFIVGADIKEIVGAQSLPHSVAYKGSQKGKAILARISALPFPTVAAIHGRCLGGGTELALSCRERVASNSKSTFIGLPEVGLGVLPGWGGTVKTPRLIGFAAALPLILNPLKAWSARDCYRRGLVSELVPESDLFGRAVSLALGEAPRRCVPGFTAGLLRRVFDSSPGRAVASAAMKLAITAKTGGKYPAPAVALAVMNAAMSLPEAEALEMESRKFAELCHTPACKDCVQKFLDYQKAKKARSVSA